ncbi:low density lipoprotein receptor adapter protein 1-like isoform X2 [Phlebotomus papatasi]|uniref:low density lipoprotein receptor adapter protein 1-like isoform X2 n=1 Tax=Phlebotomus papatasi TaxID=29031 RepID=UPI00248382A2|nr:low density lipoprotein receptor adapter protein 1-like isoform X2 [Phlebotomus papatasi]
MAFFRNIWKNSKHKKLCEEWALATNMRDFNDPYEDLEDGTEPSTFNVKYLGSTVIDAARSEDATAEAVKTVISTAKASGKKLQRVSLSVSPKGIEVHDPVSGETQQQVSVYRISYCSADATHDHVFAFVSSLDHRESTSSFGECSSSSSQSSDAPAILECHAFLCPKRKVAQEVALTVARSFGRAYELWQVASRRRKLLEEQRSEAKVHQMDTESNAVRNLLIDFGSEGDMCKDRRGYFQNTWVSFEENESSHDLNFISHLHDNSMICS